ncbi:MAG: pyrroline-5-carboxylate reductase [Paraglaciecola sp.]|uniref:pyrroline-5-carboxylate reductase n=1 Tax=Pseudomonadati TaxID=3379134 RepID=UPI00273F79D0|nr:pyrroline-5-carboxylate reductase [Paraglaciecola sp.]MDP5032888.1 pyrroline-5-carboxylate reductase [Paraglaciecola sp.]MDP5132812.1 pyrroline-5-carboxylate reductase [Paraglaciecola sp.]
MEHRRIAFIGAGNMSKSIISGLVNNGYPAEYIYASNPSMPKLDALHQQFGIQISQSNVHVVEQAQVIVLAVKPQLMAQMCADLAKQTELQDKLFVSIAAGISVQRLQEMLGGNYKVIRTMPNTPSSLGLGMTGLYANEQIPTEDRDYAGALLKHVGKIAWVEKEAMIDGVIAAAGSSPAYFFAFLEAMQHEAQQQGFDRDTARLLVQQAMLGAAEMVCQNPQLEISELRTQVTSKGGTTAQALACFADNGLSDIVAKAMQAAVARAKEMSTTF